MTGFSMANMVISPLPFPFIPIYYSYTNITKKDYTPVKFMIKCFEANYPESLGVCIVHKAPWVFQGIWKIIRGWLDPVVASKVHFTNSVTDLEAYIDKSQIISELGGNDPYDYVYVEPSEDENARLQDDSTRGKLEAERAELVQEFERLTLEWINAGSTDGATSTTARNEIADRLRKGYWSVDPYVRARSLYDRLGVLGEGGHVDWSRAKGSETGRAAGVAAGVEDQVSDVAAGKENVPPPSTDSANTSGDGGTGNVSAAHVAKGVEDQVADVAAKTTLSTSSSSGPIAAGHDPDGVD
jgi:hypothetical protein